MTEILEGQVSMFDQDTWFGKTCLEPCPQTKEQISKPSSPKLSKSSDKNAPMFLYLNDGTSQGASWESVTKDCPFPWHGEYMTDSFGEQPSTLMGEYSFPALPNGVSVSHLSQILTVSPHPKYCLSARACEGIVRRSKERGKPLPQELENALIFQMEHYDEVVAEMERQYLSKNVPESWGGKGILIQADHVGSLKTGNNQMVCAFDNPTICLQANGIGRKLENGCNGKGWRYDASYTLNTIDIPAVVDSKVYEQHSQDARYNPVRGGVSETVSSKYGTGGNNTPIVVDEDPLLFEPRSKDGVPRIHGSVSPTLDTAGGV